MQPSQPGGEPKVMRCPNCGAPVDIPLSALTTQCSYCHHAIVLAQRAPRASFAQAPAALVRSASRRTPVFVFVFAAVTMAASLTAYVSTRLTPSPTAVPTSVAARPSVQPALAPQQPVAVSYPMASLLGINAGVDIDASRAHLSALFPTIGSTQGGGELSYRLPLKHPWFGAVELNWKNAKNGKLVSAAFWPPAGEEKFKNQKEISDCLAKSLGKPEVRELDHLAGNFSYFWGRHFPKATADLSSYLWLELDDPRGVAELTFPNVVRTLAACGP